MPLVKQTTYSFGSLSAKLFLNLILGGHSSWPKFFLSSFLFSLWRQPKLWRGCQEKLFWNHVPVCPVGELSPLSELASVIFHLNSRQSWSLEWEWVLRDPAPLRQPSQTIFLELRSKCLGASKCKSCLYVQFLKVLGYLGRMIHESQLRSLLSPAYLILDAMDRRWAFLPGLPAVDRMHDGRNWSLTSKEKVYIIAFQR